MPRPAYSLFRVAMLKIRSIRPRLKLCDGWPGQLVVRVPKAQEGNAFYEQSLISRGLWGRPLVASQPRQRVVGAIRWTDFDPAMQRVRVAVLNCLLIGAFVSGGQHCFAQTNAPEIDRLHHQAQLLSEERHANQDQLDGLAKRISTMERDFAGDAVTLYWQGIRADRDRETESQSAEFFERSLQAKSTSSANTRANVAYRASVILGLIRLGEGKAKEAYQLAERALKVDPDQPDAYRLLVDASFQLNRLDAVAAMLRAKIAEDPEISSDLIDIYFSLLLERGERDKLQAAIDRQLSINPASASSRYFSAALKSQGGTKSPEIDVLYIIASLNGGRRAESTIRAQDYLSRRVLERLAMSASSETDWAWVSDMIARYEIGQRRGLPTDFSELPEVLAVAQRLPAGDHSAAILKEHLVATLELMSGKENEAKPRWENVVKGWPKFVPALCRLAELTEAEGSPESLRRAELLWKEAMALEPENPLVRDHVRLGLDIHAIADGIVIDQVADMSPIIGAGLAKGDTLLSIDGKPLKTLRPLERLRRVRLFTGGDLEWKTPTGDVMTANVPLLLLD